MRSEQPRTYSRTWLEAGILPPGILSSHSTSTSCSYCCSYSRWRSRSPTDRKGWTDYHLFCSTLKPFSFSFYQRCPVKLYTSENLYPTALHHWSFPRLFSKSSRNISDLPSLSLVPPL